ncbi:RNA-binding protein spenito-like [Biomphalaria glabrata]|uniref:RNA-binding protein spenito-like n=1 Tax=Biomphalaria glabrata TaxID=6526 RepID=A0A2C9JSQ8_BIOGL|nr:RNA-binding protein spenito-like [Biomphalaria glabrata]
MSNSVLKRSMDREGSPMSKRSRSGYAPEHELMRDRMSPDFDRRDSHSRGKYDPPGPPPIYRTEFLVHDGPPPARQYESRGPPPSGPYQVPARWPPDNNDYRSLYISGIPSKVPDNVLKDCLIDNYKRFGEMNVKITMSNDQRVAYLNFRYPEDAREALVKGIKFLFDRELKINPVFNKRRNISPSRQIQPPATGRPLADPFYNRHSPPPYDRRPLAMDPLPYASRDDYRPPPMPGPGSLPPAESERKSEKFPYHLDHVDPEYDDKATRTLFVGNLDVNITDFDLRNIFGKFGMVEDVDIKRPIRNTGNAFAFIKYINLDCAHRAKVEMSGKYIGRFQCKIGYGKVTPTTVIWVGGLGPWVTVETLEREFDRFGAIQHIEWPRNKNFAYVVYDSIDAAQAACQQMRGYPLGGPDRRLRLDFGEKEHISRSHSLPDYHYPPPKERSYGPPPERPPGPWRDSPRGPSDGPERSRYEDWQRENRDYRAPPPEAYRDESRRTDIYYYERRRERTPEYEKGSYHVGVSRSPERSRDYRDERGQPREIERSLSERRDYRERSPNGDFIENQCRSLADLAKILPVAWNGALILKSSAFATRMHVVGGDVTLVDTLMRDPTSTESPVLKITQRLRLDQPKLDDVGRRIQAAGPRGHCILLAMPSSLTNYEDNAAAIQQRPLKNLVTYLKQKEAAGVISLPPIPISGKKDVGVLHAFPPCDFGFNFLRNRAPKLSPETTKEDYLVVVVVNGVQYWLKYKSHHSHSDK